MITRRSNDPMASEICKGPVAAPAGARVYGELPLAILWLVDGGPSLMVARTLVDVPRPPAWVALHHVLQIAPLLRVYDQRVRADAAAPAALAALAAPATIAVLCACVGVDRQWHAPLWPLDVSEDNSEQSEQREGLGEEAARHRLRRHVLAR